jgi:SAM-dependent methyltransferase
MDERFHPFQKKVEDWHWWYRTRRDILDALLDRVPLDREQALLLDVGCGTGGGSLVLSRHGRAVGLDLAQSSFAAAPERPYTHRVVGSAEVIPFRDQTFDVVAALDVLEHLDDDVAGAQEIHRVLKPGGVAVIFVPAFQILWGYNDEFSHHRRRYTTATLRRTLETAGFRVENLGYFNMVLFLPLLAARLAERVAPERMKKIEYQESPTLMNEVLARLFKLELPLLRRRPLPVGTSAFCLAWK